MAIYRGITTNNTAMTMVGSLLIALLALAFDFVQDSAWYEAERNFSEFVTKSIDSKLVLLELGVGFNTPTIIRFPFEKMTREHDNITLIRLNLDQAVIPESLGNRAIGINADMAESISDILNVSVSHPYPVQEQ